MLLLLALGGRGSCCWPGCRRSSPRPKFSGDAFRLFRWRSPETRMQLYLETVLARGDHARRSSCSASATRLLGAIARSSTGCIARTGADHPARRLGLRPGLIGTARFYGATAGSRSRRSPAHHARPDDHVPAAVPPGASRRSRRAFPRSAACTRTTSICRRSTTTWRRRAADPRAAPRWARDPRRRALRGRPFTYPGGPARARARDVAPAAGHEPRAGRRERPGQDHADRC